MMDRIVCVANNGLRRASGVLFLLGFLAALVFGVADWQAAAQQPVQVQIVPGGGFVQFRRFPPGQGDSETDALDGVFLPVDRETSRQFERAKQLLDEGRYSDSITLLDEILQRNEDFFFQTPADKQSYRSLKAETQRLIGEMPAEGRQAYELQFGAKAQQMLTVAASSGDTAKLEEIARRFFHTKAGYQATLLLARRLMDHHHWLAAAECLKRLRDTAAADALEPALSLQLATSWFKSGKPELAKQTLERLRKSNPQGTVKIAGKPVRLFNENAQPVAWLKDNLQAPDAAPPAELQNWTLVRGDAARNANSAGGMPLMNPRWRVSTTNHPELEKALVEKRKEFIDQQLCFLPAMQPLAVGDVVLMRTSRNLVAVDFVTGKRTWWPSLTESSLEQRIAASSANTGTRFDPKSSPALRERFWEDATYGTLSSDGERVYLIDDLDNPADAQADMNGQVIVNGGGRLMINGRPFRGGVFEGAVVPFKPNKLTAVDLRTQGKLKWIVGGQSGEEEPQLANAFFLGPPLPLEEKLYVLAEIKQEIKLCVLDSKTGHLNWSQQIAVVEPNQNIQNDQYRRLAGCTPSYSDGVLVCPTAAGAIVAVDVANRSLLWGYRYPRPKINQAMMRQPWNNPQQNNLNQQERWVDSTVTIADGCVIVTPIDSDQLHCLDLQDGKTKWGRPLDRGENLYIAGANHGNVVLVGKRQLTAIKLADGKPAWTPVNLELPTGAMPSGRGFLTGDNYYLPLTTAEVARIDLTAGKITAQAKSRKGTIPGNLICYQGDVISQGVDYVESFFQLEPLQKRVAAALEKNPNDAWALAHRGEIALEEGKLDVAIADARHAYQSDATPFNRDLLIEVLIAGLTTDFQKHKTDVDDLEQLVQLDHERAVFLRVLAAGLQKNGNAVAAAETYLKLATLDPQMDAPEEIDTNFAVLRSQWIRAQFRSLLSSAKEADRPQIDAAVAKRLDQSVAKGTAKALREFIACFGDHPSADRARELLAEKLTGAENLLEREQLLREVQKSSDETRRAAASVKLAALFNEAGQTDEALKQYRALESTFGDKPVLNGKNVKQLLAALPTDSPLRQAKLPATHWPDGEVKVERTAARGLHIAGVNRLIPLEFRGSRQMAFEDVTVALSPESSQIIGYDGLGKERFRLGLIDGNPNMVFQQQPNLLAGSVMAQGHVLIVSLGNQVLALDTLKSTAGANNRVLWRKDLIDGPALGNYATPMVATRPWGGRKIQMRFGTQPIGNVGPATALAVFYQRGRDVMAVDLLTGNPLWVRHGVEPGCDIFGDDEVLMLTSPTEPKGWAVRAADGELISDCPVPPPEQRWTTYGHNLLYWKSLPDGSQSLRLIDPLSQRELWTENFTAGVQGTIVGDESVALLQSDGKFVMLSLADGKKTISEQLEKETNMKGIHVVRSASQDILLTSRVDAGGSDRMQATVPFYNGYAPGSEVRPEITGNVYAFDRSKGKPLWPAPAKLQHQSLVTDLPSELPVLVFTRNLQSLSNNRQQQIQGSILVLDRRSGRVLYEDEKASQVFTIVDALGNPEDHTIALQMPPDAITLKFTETPIAPEPPFQDGVFEKPISALERSRAGSIFRALSGMMSSGGIGRAENNAEAQSKVAAPAAEKK